jgi:hypothetical protein
VVWARVERAEDVRRELEASLDNATVLPLAVAQEGAHQT